jgi:hypothetical protein
VRVHAVLDFVAPAFAGAPRIARCGSGEARARRPSQRTSDAGQLAKHFELERNPAEPLEYFPLPRTSAGFFVLSFGAVHFATRTSCRGVALLHLLG